MMHDRLRDRAIIVIGAGTGIGAATAARLCAEGARVCVADINITAAHDLATRMTMQGYHAFAQAIDIADETSVDAAVAAAVERLGGLDGAHVNAADLRTIFADNDLLSLEMATFDRTITVNLRGHVLCARATLPHLLKSGHGAIVFTSSDAADAGEPERPSYAMSKSAVNALMRHIASRWGKHGLTANCVAPGFVLTDEMIAGGQVPPAFVEQCIVAGRSPRLGVSDDIAAMVVHLLSQDARWINGQVFHVNGGALLT